MKYFRFSVAGILMAVAVTAGASSLEEAAAQTSPWSFGFGGGVNISQLHYSDLDKNIFPDNKSNTSGLFTFYVERVFGKHGSFGVRPQITLLTRGGHLCGIYSKTGVDFESDELNPDFYEENGIDDIRYGLKATYFDIRVPLTYYVGRSDWRFRPYVYVAPVVGFAHRGFIYANAAMDNGSYAGVRYDLSKANMSSFMFAGAVGIGARFNFAINGTICNIGLDVSYQYGFTNTYGTEQDGNVENIVAMVPDAGNKSEGSRHISGLEIAGTIGIPFNVFTPKEKPAQIVYVDREVIREVPVSVPVAETKDCYSLEEITTLMAKGENVRGKTICAVDDINFDFGKSEIKPSSFDYLNKLAMTLKRTGAHIIVKGHTDNVGSPESNMELSRRRAQSVMNYLKELGVPSDLINCEAYGMSNPLTSNDTEDGRRLNRRVEFEIR